MTRLLVATTNPHKFREIRAILSGLPLSIASLADYGPAPAAPENCDTFAENARAKALHYGRVGGVPTVAEDSGLEIDALDGRPGVESARYNGRTYPEKFRALYAELAARGHGPHAARFVCAVALAIDEEIVFEAAGVVEGTIAPAPRGAGGFGYDPVFYYPPYERTLAEITPDEKAAVSHRGRAFRALRVYLMDLGGL